MVPCSPGEPSLGPFPRLGRGCDRQGRPAAGERWPLGSGWTSDSNRQQLLFPSDRFPSHFFFSAAGSTARIDGAASPTPLSFLSLLLISALINQPPTFPLGDEYFLSHEGSRSHTGTPPPQSTSCSR